MTGINGLTRTAERLDDDAFISLLNMLMEADPWPYSINRDPIENLLDSEARARGYCDWIEALHQFMPPSPRSLNTGLLKGSQEKIKRSES